MNQSRRIEHGRVLLIVLVVLGSAACGSRPAVLGKAFQSKAVAVCQAALAQKKSQGPFPYPDFNPTKPDLSKLPAIAALEATTVNIYETWMGQMLALGQPSAGQAAWADVLKALKSHVRIIVEQQAAAQHGDGQTFTKDYYEATKLRTRWCVRPMPPACRSVPPLRLHRSAPLGRVGRYAAADADQSGRAPPTVAGGQPERCAEILRPFRDVGVGDFLMLSRAPADERTMELFAKQVAPAMRA